MTSGVMGVDVTIIIIIYITQFSIYGWIFIKIFNNIFFFF